MSDRGRVRRRTLAALAAAASVAPIMAPIMAPRAARAQARGPVRIGYAYVGAPELVGSRVELLVSGIRASGFQGEIEPVVRLTGGDPSRLAPVVAEILAQKVAVYIAAGPAMVRVARAATDSVPIVAYDFESDPVAEGFVQSVARPGGNITGVFLDVQTFVGKWLEFLRECLPSLARVALVWDPDGGRLQVDALTRIARDLGIATDIIEVHTRPDYDTAFARAAGNRVGAVILLSTPMVFAHTRDLAALSLQHRLPAITMFAEFARAGGLMAYGPSLLGATKQAGFIAGHILGGQPPGVLPVEQPSIYNLAINLRTAAMLGIAPPPALLARADDVIE